MTNPQPLRLIGYRRVSTAGQVDRYGLPAQLTDLKKYPRGKAIRLVDVQTDPGLSGTLPADERPGLLAALKAIESGQADGLLVPGDLDRLSRDLMVQEAVLAKVWKAGGVVHTTLHGEIAPDDPDNPMRTFIRQVMGGVAQLDRALVAKRMRNGRKEKAAQGGYAGYGSPSFGVKSVNAELIPDEREQAAIIRIGELRAEGTSFGRIAETLNAEGIKSKRGGTWSAMTVKRVCDRL